MAALNFNLKGGYGKKKSFTGLIGTALFIHHTPTMFWPEMGKGGRYGRYISLLFHVQAVLVFNSDWYPS